MNTMEVLVIGAKQYRFLDEKTGQMIEGTKVFFIQKEKTDRNINGLEPGSASFEHIYFDTLPTLPRLATAEIGMTMSGGKIRTRVVGFTFNKDEYVIGG